MSFLVQGIDVPKNCGIGGRDGLGCPCFCHYNSRCQVSNKVIDTAYYRDHDRPSDCPVFPVPPHGRLGDLDALSKALRDEALQHTIIGDLNRMALGAGEVIDRLNNATTIIPAEEGDT